MRKNAFLITCGVIFFASMTNVQAADLSLAEVWSENSYYADANEPSYSILADLIVDTTDFPVYVCTSPISCVELRRMPGWDGFYPYMYAYRFYDPAPGADWEDTTYTFHVDEVEQNGRWDVGEAKTEWYIGPGDIRKIGLVENVTVSAGPNPRISWEPPTGADAYKVRLFPVADGKPDIMDLLWQSDLISEDGSNSYHVDYLGVLFKHLGPLAVAIQAFDFKSGLIRNRSTYLTVHNPCPSGCCKGDLDKDHDIDARDLATFAIDFGRTDCP